MFPGRLGEQNAPGEPKLAALRIGMDFPAGGGDRNLESPAASKERNPGRKHCLGEIDLMRHRRSPVVDVEGRPRHGDAIIIIEADARRKLSGAVRREYDVDLERCVYA